MKKAKTLFMCLLMSFAITACFSQTSASFAAASTNATANVIFMRSTGYSGSAVAFTSFIDDNLVCKLNNKRFSTHVLEPGEHRFSVQFAGKESKGKAEHITINIEAGKTYYIQMVFQPGLLVNNLYCQEVTESSAKMVLPQLKEDSKCL